MCKWRTQGGYERSESTSIFSLASLSVLRELLIRKSRAFNEETFHHFAHDPPVQHSPTTVKKETQTFLSLRPSVRPSVSHFPSDDTNSKIKKDKESLVNGLREFVTIADGILLFPIKVPESCYVTSFFSLPPQ